MQKIINKTKIKASLFGLGVLALVGCKNIEPEIVVPKTIEGINIETIDDKEIVKFDELKDVNVYFEYTVSNDSICYGSNILKEVDTDDYVAYYSYVSGNLVGIDFKKKVSDIDKFYYRNYTKGEYIRMSSLEEQFNNPDNTKTIREGIHFDENYVDYKTLRLMDASMIPHNREEFSEELDYVYKEKKLTR